MDDLDSHSRRRLPSAPMLVAMLALLVSLGGTATAARLLITSRDIKDGTIRLVDLSAGTKTSLHAHAQQADDANVADQSYALSDSASFQLIHASSAPKPGELLPLDQQGRFPASVLPTIAARIYSSKSEQNPIQIAFGPVQRLTFDSVSFDTDHLFDARHPADLTAPISGVYLITTNVSWAIAPNGTVGINRAVTIYVNNHPVAIEQAPPAGQTRQVVTTLYKLAAGDVVEVGIGQDGGGMVAEAVGDYAPSLAMALIGPSS